MAGEFRQFKEQLLLALVKAGQPNPGGFIEPKAVANDTGLSFTPGWVRQATKALEADGLLDARYLDGTGEPDGAMMARVTGKGWEVAEELEDRRAADGAFAVVRIDHSSSEYLAVSTALSDLTRAVETNNSFAASEAENHEQCVAELESGSRLLKAVKVRLDAVLAVLVKALKWLAAKFRDAAIGLLAKQALTAIAALFGIPL